MGKPKTWYTSGIISTRNLRFGTEGKFYRRWLSEPLPLRCARGSPAPHPSGLRSPTAIRCPDAHGQMLRRSLPISVFVLVLWYNQKR